MANRFLTSLRACAWIILWPVAYHVIMALSALLCFMALYLAAGAIKLVVEWLI